MRESGDKRSNGPRCSATTKAGNPCKAIAGSDGLCTAHSGRTDMRALGRKGGEVRRRGPAAQLLEPEREGLREKLKQLDHDTIVAAIERALAGNNESARVSAIKFLADLELYRTDDREQERRAEAAHYAERLEELIRDRARRERLAGRGLVEAEKLWQAARELWQEAGDETVGGVVVQDVSAEEARATLEGLAAVGLIRPPQSAFERDELAERDAEIARLKMQLTEFAGVA